MNAMVELNYLKINAKCNLFVTNINRNYVALGPILSLNVKVIMCTAFDGAQAYMFNKPECLWVCDSLLYWCPSR